MVMKRTTNKKKIQISLYFLIDIDDGFVTLPKTPII